MAEPQRYSPNLWNPCRSAPGLHVFLVSTCPRLPRGLDLNDFSYLTIHNVDHHPMPINIRNTGINKLDPTTASTCPAILSRPAKHRAPDQQPTTNNEQRTLDAAARTNAQVEFHEHRTRQKFLNSFHDNNLRPAESPPNREICAQTRKSAQ